MTRRLLLPLLAASLLAILPRPALSQTKTLDDLVLALVNGEEITRRQLVDRLIEYNGAPARERLVNRAVMLQAGKEANETVSEAELDKRMEEIRSHFSKPEDYHAFLAQNHLTEKQHREEARGTLLLQRLALKKDLITDDDLSQYDIRMAVTPEKATAEKWVQELDNGGTFEAIAERCADPALAASKGRMRPFLKVEMLDLAQAVEDQKLKPGGYTKSPVQINGKNWAVIKLENRIPVTTASAAERDRLTALVTRYRMDEWLNQRRAQAKVELKPLTDAVVAVVNGESITREQLVNRLLEFYGQAELDRTINRTLLLQAGKQLMVSVTDQEADQRLAEFRKQFPTDDGYQAFLTRAAVSERQFRDEIRYTMLMERVALKETPVTDADLVRYDVRMLVAPTRTKAEEWIKELAAGADFEKMVKQRSQDPDGRQSGGRLQPFIRIELLDVWRPLDEQKVKPGEITRMPVLLTDGTWCIMKLEGVLPPTALSAEERERLTRAVTQYRVNQWLTKTLEQAKSQGKISRPVPVTAAISRT